MSRSKHTDPRAIRAGRRLRSPREPRSAGDLSRRRRFGRILKEMGIADTFVDAWTKDEAVRPRVIVRRPQQGFSHPAGKADVHRVLELLGPEAIYGLRTIELARAPDMTGSDLPPLGRLEAPGRITLYEQPAPPWRLSGIVSAGDVERCRRAGAGIEFCGEVEATIIDWPGDTLRYFMLFEVFLHEVGHHILQHDKGKRTQRIARTRDHEAFAERFADRCRAAWFSEETSE